MKLGLPFSIAVIIWIIAGLLRYLHTKKIAKRKNIPEKIIKEKRKKVAVCIPAHNEELVLKKTIQSVKKLVRENQIHVVSDGSSDKTVEIARKQRVKILELNPGKGKGKALVALIKRFKILKKYDFILFIDSEVIPNPNFLNRALRVFSIHPDTAAIAGYVITPWRKHKHLSFQKFINAYRVRLNLLLQMFIVYGQTTRFFNTAMVLPGGCSIYRTDVMSQLRLDTPGILIEDFNLAFQIHKKKLGKIAHYPNIFIYDQEPQSFKDYWNQVKRWNIGYLQTIRKFGVWPSSFWVMTGMYTLEVIVNALAIVFLPTLIISSTIQLYGAIIDSQASGINTFIAENYLHYWEIFLVVFIIDYLLTIFVVIKERKLLLAVYGFGFLFFRFMDSVIFLFSIKQGIFSTSKGSWTPPKRS